MIRAVFEHIYCFGSFGNCTLGHAWSNKALPESEYRKWGHVNLVPALQVTKVSCTSLQIQKLLLECLGILEITRPACEPQWNEMHADSGSPE